MATYTKIKFSDTPATGRPVFTNELLSGFVHTTTTTDTTLDEVWLWANNTTSTDRVLSVDFNSTGGTPVIETTVPANSTALVIPGHPISSNSGSAEVLIVSATAGTITIHGYVNRIA